MPIWYGMKGANKMVSTMDKTANRIAEIMSDDFLRCLRTEIFGGISACTRKHGLDVTPEFFEDMGNDLDDCIGNLRRRMGFNK